MQQQYAPGILVEAVSGLLSKSRRPPRPGDLAIRAGDFASITLTYPDGQRFELVVRELLPVPPDKVT
jgi:hypothetical protein